MATPIVAEKDEMTEKKEILKAISNHIIVNVRTKEKVCLSTLWKDRNVVIQFMRRFGCMLCRMASLHISRIKTQLEKNNTTLIAIGFEWAGAEEFVNHDYFTGDIYVDGKRKCYQDLGFKKYKYTFSALLALAKPAGRRAMTQAWREGVRGNLLEGDGLQNGGQLVISKGGNDILLLYKEDVPGDCVENYAILESLNIADDDDDDDDSDISWNESIDEMEVLQYSEPLRVRSSPNI